MTYKHCVCQICLEYKLCDEHHVWKRAVWGHGKTNSETEFVCLDCHHIIDEIIKVKESEILKQYPEIYAGTFNKLIAVGLSGIRNEAKKYNVPLRRKRKRRR